MSTLHIDSITKSFGSNKILQDVYLSCETGKIVGILGRNGQGKSTLLQIIFGTDKQETLNLLKLMIKFYKIKQTEKEEYHIYHNIFFFRRKLKQRFNFTFLQSGKFCQTFSIRSDETSPG